MFFVGRAAGVVDVEAVAWPDAVGAAPVMPITFSVVVLAFPEADTDAKEEPDTDTKEEDSGVISVTRLLGIGVTDRDDRIEDSCAATHGDKAVQSRRGIVEETMRIDIDDAQRKASSLECRALKRQVRLIDIELGYLDDRDFESQMRVRQRTF